MKRVVYRNSEGLHYIIGLIDAPPSEVLHLGSGEEINLIKVTPRYVLYIEPLALKMGTLNEFNPEQK